MSKRCIPALAVFLAAQTAAGVLLLAGGAGGCERVPASGCVRAQQAESETAGIAGAEDGSGTGAEDRAAGAEGDSAAALAPFAAMEDESFGNRRTMLVGGAALMLLLTSGAMVTLRVRARRRAAELLVPASDQPEWPLPPLFVPPGMAAGRNDPRPVPFPTPLSAPAAAAPAARGGGGEGVVAPPSAATGAVAPLPPPAGTTAAAPRMSGPVAPGPLSTGGVAAPPRGPDAELTADGTLQLLPGRFELVRGDERMREIRFVRSPGRAPHVTIGRSEGDPASHVRLDSLTVSRVHAAMHYVDGRWQIENRSATNPVLVNAAALEDERLHPLQDGDLVELGEVALRYRAV